MTEDDALLVQALVDGELDARAAAALEARLPVEPELATVHARLQALRSKLREIPVAPAPDAMRRRILALAEQAPTSSPVRSARRSGARPGWPTIAALAASLVVGTTGGWLGATLARPPAETQSLVAAHVRGLVAGRPFDVASSDNHTVRPWFAGKIAAAPFVADLAGDGFPLEGGRVDIVEGVAEPTLVYRRGPHTISVTRLPGQSSAAGTLRPAHGTVEGHATLAWRGGEASYLAVSDAAPGELDALRAAFERARQAEAR